MAKEIKFAVIGTSEIAAAHIRAIRNNPCARVNSIYSRDIERAKEFARRYGLTPIAAYEEILRDDTINAVDIVTEPNRHASLALEAIKNHKHVLIEKPLDTDIASAKDAVLAAASSKMVVSVISQKRFEPEIINMKRKLEGKIIGKPYLAEIRLMWPRDADYYKKGTGWRGEIGNVLVNQAIHWLDIAIWFFGVPVKATSLLSKVKEDINCYDTAICSLEFANNVILNLTCSTAVNCREPDTFRIYGTKGLLDYSGEKRKRPAVKILNKAKVFLKISKSPLERQIDNFIACIIHKGTPAVSILDGLRALEAVRLCEMSAAKLEEEFINKIRSVY